VLLRSLRMEGYEARGPSLRRPRRRSPTPTSSAPDLVVLDLGLPKIDGIDVRPPACASNGDVPIPHAHRARDAVEVRASRAPLDAGADDYLVKPFERPGVAARRALARPACGGAPPRGSASLVVGDPPGSNPDTHEGAAREAGQNRGSRSAEVRAPGVPPCATSASSCPRQRLLRGGLGLRSVRHDETPSRCFVSNLRRKLEAGGMSRVLLHTIRGAGLYVSFAP